MNIFVKYSEIAFLLTSVALPIEVRLMPIFP